VRPAVADAHYAVAQYEALRREALEVAPFGPRGHGLVLLLTRGLPAWLVALTALGPSRPGRPLAETPAELRPWLLPSARLELTTVLAGMVLACTQGTEGR
jgi:hypothetical protein